MQRNIKNRVHCVSCAEGTEIRFAPFGAFGPSQCPPLGDGVRVAGSPAKSGGKTPWQ